MEMPLAEPAPSYAGASGWEAEADVLTSASKPARRRDTRTFPPHEEEQFQACEDEQLM